MFHQNDSYGQAGLEGVKRAMTKRGLTIAALGTNERNSTDVAAAVKAIGDAKPEAMVMITAYSSAAEFIRQMKKLPDPTLFFNVSFVGSKALAEALGKDGHGVMISQVVPFPWSPMTPVVKEYLGLAKAAKVDVNFSSLEGFIAAKVLVEGLRRTGKEPTRERFIAALESISALDFGGFQVSFSPTNHNGSQFVDLSMIGRDGSSCAERRPAAGDGGLLARPHVRRDAQARRCRGRQGRRHRGIVTTEGPRSRRSQPVAGSASAARMRARVPQPAGVAIGRRGGAAQSGHARSLARRADRPMREPCGEPCDGRRRCDRVPRKAEQAPKRLSSGCGPDTARCGQCCWCPEEDSNLHSVATART